MYYIRLIHEIAKTSTKTIDNSYYLHNLFLTIINMLKNIVNGKHYGKYWKEKE